MMQARTCNDMHAILGRYYLWLADAAVSDNDRCFPPQGVAITTPIKNSAVLAMAAIETGRLGPHQMQAAIATYGQVETADFVFRAQA